MGWLVAALAGLLTGILSGLGIGGGTLLLLYMTVLGGVEQTAAQGINLLYFLPAAATSLPSHFKNGFVDKAVALPAILAGLVTTGIAAWIATGLDVALLRRCFGGFLIYVGLTELFRKKER
ncbi:MAG: sulfite exporter TauE/SafE family protein [Oscillospiraceae bacterium]